MYIVITSKITGLNLCFFTKFSYNNASSITTSISLSFYNKNYSPSISVYSKHNITFS